MSKFAAKIGSAAGRLGSGHFNVNALRPYIDKNGNSRIVVGHKRSLLVNTPALLQYDEWKDIDRRVIEVAVDRLTGIADLQSRGLTHPLGSIGNTISMWERQSDMTPAEVSMSTSRRSENDRVEYDNKQVPVPIVHKDFGVDLRHLEASRKFGESVDTTQSEIAGRLVAEKSEDMLFAGNTGIVIGGSVIYGYTSHPDRNGVDMVKQWTANNITGAEILADVQAMLAAARADRYFGPFVMYIPGAYEGVLDNDFNPETSDTRTIRQRIMALSGIAEIKVADRLANHNVLLVQMTRDVVDLAVAQDITTVQWDEQGGMRSEFHVMAVWVPRIKSTFDGQSGIVHLYEIE